MRHSQCWFVGLCLFVTKPVKHIIIKYTRLSRQHQVIIKSENVVTTRWLNNAKNLRSQKCKTSNPLLCPTLTTQHRIRKFVCPQTKLKLKPTFHPQLQLITFTHGHNFCVFIIFNSLILTFCSKLNKCEKSFAHSFTDSTEQLQPCVTVRHVPCERGGATLANQRAATGRVRSLSWEQNPAECHAAKSDLPRSTRVQCQPCQCYIEHGTFARGPTRTPDHRTYRRQSCDRQDQGLLLDLLSCTHNRGHHNPDAHTHTHTHTHTHAHSNIQ